MNIDRLETERLILRPYTRQMCHNLMQDNDIDIQVLGLVKGVSWPDKDVLETLPKILHNLLKVESPTGFESWMIIKKNTSEIIGDIGFKGYDGGTKSIDIGYGIIVEERKKGYASEAAVELIRWAFSTGTVDKITANCLIDNMSSSQLLAKLNFTQTKQDDHMMYWVLMNDHANK